MWPPSAPGHRALDEQQAALLVDAHDRRAFCTVRVTLPYWPAIRLPGNTRPGSCAIEIEPGVLCERELPCDARLRAEVVALDHAGEAACRSSCPSRRPSGRPRTCRRRRLSPGLKFAELVGRDAELLQHLARPRRRPSRDVRPSAW